MRIGHGYDVHRLTEGRRMILGGVEIPYETHAVMDSLLGAAALGDIGRHFPDSDPLYLGADSLELLRQVCHLLKKKNYHIENIDATILAQRPKLMPYLAQMRENLAKACEISLDCINIKATTEEGLGFTGALEGIAAHAVCLIV